MVGWKRGKKFTVLKWPPEFWGQKGVQPSTSKGYLVKCLVTICTKCIQLSAVVEWEPLKCVPYHLPCNTWDNECMEN